MKKQIKKSEEKYTEEQLNELGEKIGKELGLRKSIENPDRYNLRLGDKTNIRLARTIIRIFDEMEK